MVEKGYKAISVKRDIAVNIQQRAKEEKKSISDFLNGLLNGEGVLLEFQEAPGCVTKEDLKRAITGLENDITVLVRDAVKDAFAEIKY